MLPLTESAIRTSFVNCSRGEAKRLAVPKDLEMQPWDDLDFLGWRDPAAPQRAYLVAETDGKPVGWCCGPRRTRRGACGTACARSA
ncbi:FBP domain-containing protein [Micromonospora sp. M12]